jgi:hypothetical protein
MPDPESSSADQDKLRLKAPSGGWPASRRFLMQVGCRDAHDSRGPPGPICRTCISLCSWPVIPGVLAEVVQVGHQARRCPIRPSSSTGKRLCRMAQNGTVKAGYDTTCRPVETPRENTISSHAVACRRPSSGSYLPVWIVTLRLPKPNLTEPLLLAEETPAHVSARVTPEAARAGQNA